MQAAICALLLLAPSAHAQKFINSGERLEQSQRTIYAPDCKPLSEHFSACFRESDFTLDELTYDNQDRGAFFRFEGQPCCAFNSLFYPLGEAQALSPEELERVVIREMFTEAARGARTKEARLEIKRDRKGYINSEATVVTDATGARSLLQYRVHRVQWGLGFMETVIKLDDGVFPNGLTSDQKEFHYEFLRIFKHSWNHGPGYR